MLSWPAVREEIYLRRRLCLPGSRGSIGLPLSSSPKVRWRIPTLQTQTSSFQFLRILVIWSRLAIGDRISLPWKFWQRGANSIAPCGRSEMEFTSRLVELGWDSFFKSNFEEFKQTTFMPARVIEELRGFYRVRTADAEYLAEVSRQSFNIRPSARDDFPAVGDWVAIVARRGGKKGEDRAHPATEDQASP